jgi:cyclophilin family peptidyl-prolyl cis-trans isomerase
LHLRFAANAGYFDDTVFHRIVLGFVIQGGDPTATGAGGPGYTTVDTPARDTKYTSGIVAMAKMETEPRGAAGSQFFVETGDELALAPDYAVIGEVTSGLDAVARIGALGDPATEQPTTTVVVESLEIRRGS